MSVRFYRKYNRTATDIFGNKFQHRLKMELHDAVQKISFYCRKNHTWQNRTGALEESIGFEEPIYKGGFWQAVVKAGGWSRVKFAFNVGLRRATGKRKRNARYQRGQRFNPGKGTGLFVNYAYWVEKKGFPVLIQGIEHYKRLIGKVLAANLKVRKIGL